MTDAIEHVRIAFIMGGGVSLGTFSAGALAQVIEDFDTAVSDPDHPLKSCELDVWSGASAGAVTLGLALHELFANRSPHPELRRFWVETLDVEGFYPKNLNDHKEPSLFVSQLLNQELARFKTPETKPQPDDPIHKLLPQNRPVSMGFSLTSLNGVRFKADLQEGFEYDDALADTATTTFYKDWQKFLLSMSPDDPKTTRKGIPVDVTKTSGWGRVGLAAMASGAFPLAFIPRIIDRHKVEFGYQWPHDDETRKRAYVDGGLLNNEPLKLAIEMARDADEEFPPQAGRENTKRIFIVIDPNISTVSNADDEFFVTGDLESSGPPGARDIAGRMATVVMAQASVKDWLKAQKTNHRVEWADHLTQLLAGIIRATPTDTLDTGELEELLRDIICTKYKATSARNEPPSSEQLAMYRELHKERITGKWGQQIKGMTSDQQSLFIDLVALLENAAGLRRKEKLAMIGIAPEKTAGGFLRGFGGFFQQSYREHDFRLGCAIANEVMGKTPLNFPPDSQATRPGFIGGKYESVPARLRSEFEKYAGRFAVAVTGLHRCHPRALALRFAVPKVIRSRRSK